MKHLGKQPGHKRSSPRRQPPDNGKRKTAAAKTAPVGYPPFDRGEHGPHGQGWFDEAELSEAEREEKRRAGADKKLRGRSSRPD